jgi:hypothetical protein
MNDFHEKRAADIAKALRAQVEQWLVVADLEHKLATEKALLEGLHNDARSLSIRLPDPRIVIAEYEGETIAVVVDKQGIDGFTYTYAEINPDA